MKTKLLFLIAGLISCMYCKAQNVSTPPSNEDFQHHEFSVSYGFLPISDWSSIGEEILFPVLTFGLYQRQNTHYYGALNFSYTYRLNPKISFGVTGGISANKGTVGNLYENDKTGKRDDRMYLYFLPTFRYHWFVRSKFSLYSSVGIGAYFLRNRIDQRTYHKTKLAYQINYLGIEYGKRATFFVELGAGNAGTIIAGGRFRF